MQKIKKQTCKRLLMMAIVGCILYMPLTTFAFWTQELRPNDKYHPGKYSTKIEEIFEAPVDWLPGESVKGNVLVVNDGEEPVFAKALVNIEWFGQDEITKEDYELTFVEKRTKNREYAALMTWGTEVVLLSGGEAYERTLSFGLPIVNDATKAQGKWLLLDEKPDKKGNLTFHYIGILKKGEKTPLLIDSVQMNPKIEAKTMEKHTTYNQENKSWQTEYKINPSFSYENARFLLTVKVQTAQAYSNEKEENIVLPKPLQPINQPKTGDRTELIIYIVSMLSAIAILLGCAYILKKQKGR